MMEVLTIVGTASPLIKPALDGLSNLVRALKEPAGKRKLEDMRTELTDGLSAVRDTLERQAEVIDKLISENQALSNRLAYLELPFYKRWFTQRPH
jgi:hypothetical protein